MSQRNATAAIEDLYNVNRVLKKVELKESGVSYGHVGKKNDLRIFGIGDELFKTDENALGVIILLFTKKEMTRASPIY